MVGFTMGDTIAGSIYPQFQIDPNYEFSAPHYFDFIQGETSEEAREAERWFKTACTYAASRELWFHFNGVGTVPNSSTGAPTSSTLDPTARNFGLLWFAVGIGYKNHTSIGVQRTFVPKIKPRKSVAAEALCVFEEATHVEQLVARLSPQYLKEHERTVASSTGESCPMEMNTTNSNDPKTDSSQVVHQAIRVRPFSIEVYNWTALDFSVEDMILEASLADLAMPHLSLYTAMLSFCFCNS
eukprot:Gb_03405 [translate_table: standard]